MTDDLYTYRAGRKVPLRKRDDQFVVRALPATLGQVGFDGATQMSSASSRVSVSPGNLEAAMTRARGVAPTHHSYERGDTGEEFLITDRVIVKFRHAPSAEELGAFAGRYGLVQRKAYSDREFLFQLTDHTGMNPVKLIVALNENEEVVAAADHDLNQRMRRYQLALPTDPGYAQQWHLHTSLSDPDFDIRSSSRCEQAWELLGNFGSGDVVVGITDDGCLLSHDDFDSPGKFAGWAYLDGEQVIRSVDIGADPDRMYQQDANHGTACAGVAAGESDAVLTVGAAPGCRLLPVKWESDDYGLYVSDSKMRDVLDYVADKVDVLSNSWGATPRSEWSSLVLDRIAELTVTGGRRGRGILFLWAAGNENCPISHRANVDVPYTDGWKLINNSWHWVGVQTSRVFINDLVGIDGVMHVAALASTAQRSHYSNYGTGIDVCAPSNNVHEYYRLDLPGLSILAPSGPSSTGTTPSFGGTSSATPLVAGVAALVISANPALTAREVASVLRRTAFKNLELVDYPRTPVANFDPNPTWDISPVEPFDAGNFQNTGHPDGTWSPWFGHGKVDAEAAVAAALQPPANGPTGSTLQFSVSPDKKIPDNKTSGLKSVIEVPNDGVVESLRVGVSIRHTWRGDLRVSLSAPDQSTVVLHDRTGSSQNDLLQTYDMGDLPSLLTLKGKPIKGKWTLLVQDLAAADTGRLESWSLEIGVAGAPSLVEDATAVAIPDDDPAGIVRELEVTSGDAIRDVTVAVDVTHPWIGDLRVTLQPPGAAALTLHDRAGGSADNLIRSWSSIDHSGLRALRGRSGGGVWRLHVADLAQRDKGKLNRWTLRIDI